MSIFLCLFQRVSTVTDLHETLHIFIVPETISTSYFLICLHQQHDDLRNLKFRAQNAKFLPPFLGTESEVSNSYSTAKNNPHYGK